MAVDGEIIGAIGYGLLVFLGIGQGDNEQIAKQMIDKILKLRIFPDSLGKTNLSIDDVGGDILVVSQFTLYADCKKGNRPSFTNAASPDQAEALYEYFVDECKPRFKNVASGSFGAYMKVNLENDGPFTVILEM